MNDKTNITLLASAKPANGKTHGATQKAPPAAPQAISHFAHEMRADLAKRRQPPP